MSYCVEVECQNATGGKYAVLGQSWHTFPLHDMPLVDQWLHNMARKFSHQIHHVCVEHILPDWFVQDLDKKTMGKFTQDP